MGSFLRFRGLDSIFLEQQEHFSRGGGRRPERQQKKLRLPPPYPPFNPFNTNYGASYLNTGSSSPAFSLPINHDNPHMIPDNEKFFRRPIRNSAAENPSSSSSSSPLSNILPFDLPHSQAFHDSVLANYLRTTRP